MASWIPRVFVVGALFTSLAGCSDRDVGEPESEIQEPLMSAAQQKLTASDGAASDAFGGSVSVSGETALVGAVYDSDTEDYSGSAYVFVKSGTSWAPQQKLTASDGVADDFFAWSVSVSGETALVGAIGDDDEGGDSGSAYVFVRSGTTWAPQQKLTAGDGEPSNFFGYAVSVSGETALVGAFLDNDNGLYSGSAYVFARSGTSWALQQKLTADDGASGYSFGVSVSVSGETALVGASGDDDMGASSGSAYVFVRSGTSWAPQQKLTAGDGVTGDIFATSVSVSGETALVGATGDDDMGDHAGSVYVFVRSGTSWAPQQKLTAGDGAPTDYFGFSVSVSGETALVGAYGDDDQGDASGSAYVFMRTGTSWAPQQKLTAGAGAAGDDFGYSVSVSGEAALVGAYGDDDQGVDSGLAYAFRFGLQDGDPCSLDSECLSLFCVENVCCNTACDGTCQTCLAARKASGTDGICGDVEAGTDPRASCNSEAESTCGNDGKCDGAGACALHSAGTECAPASCASATSENSADTCDGSGTCDVTEEADCDTGYTCVDGACKTSCDTDSDCDTDGGFACNDDGACAIPEGKRCNGNSDCDTGHCTDGFCCDAACEGQCEACDVADKEGTCVAVEGLPHDDGNRDACNDFGDPECAARCDGEHRDECQFVPAASACGASVCEEGSEVVSLCDGQGQCEAQDPETCAPYVCGTGSCRADCDSDTDCTTGFECDAGKCIPEGGAATAPKSTPTEDSGCGCRTVGSQRRDPLPFALVTGLGLMALRRRRTLPPKRDAVLEENR